MQESTTNTGTTNVPWPQAAGSYAIDAWQRSILYADVMRRRGNQYHQHMAEEVPNVLDFTAEIVMSGLELARPVNYGLVRILAPHDEPADETRRPFVVVDPRAGHGPGIGGFKAESEIGVALRAGHPCYFIGFLPDPAPGQTVEDVMHAEAAFLEKVIALHPRSEGKPAVIGNCQAGWQILMTVALRPELFGPIIVAGAPVSYWAGWHGRNPMRYSGGLLGGSWGTALAGDLGNGRFDGASLVQNFENLNPANTLWGKKYNLYANIDSEAERYLGFEKYWGGHVFLNQVEMQYIVDNLFVGNRLATAELITADGVRLDLRNIRSPIVVFCSNGDNITPPPQALGWITDLYRDDTDVLTHDQTIVYAVHDSIGHLGIFVSGSVGRKEHQKFASNIDLIDLLPAGIYQALIEDKTAATPNPELASGDFVLSIQRRGIGDVREIVRPDPENERKFATVARVSEINLGLYRQFVQPWVRAAVTPLSARWMQGTHPLRVSYEAWSDRHPLAPLVAREAEKIRQHRQPVAADNPLLQMQRAWSAGVIAALDNWRDWRDMACEQVFDAVYGAPWLQALAGLGNGQAPRPQPAIAPEHCAFVKAEVERLRGSVGQGGLAEAGIRALCFIHRLRGVADERRFNLAQQLHQSAPGDKLGIAGFRQVVRQQARLMLLDQDAAMAALPVLLARGTPDQIDELARMLQQMVNMPLPPSADEKASLDQVLQLFDQAARSRKNNTVRLAARA
ncbi:DUF3141 domain-containing protein [Janthinobacterium agaricidamnosum]|nr:DUF3141 domain-containing protein [Janthinobacterium agaricidamnosum]